MWRSPRLVPMSQRSDPLVLAPSTQLNPAWTLVMSSTVVPVGIWPYLPITDHAVSSEPQTDSKRGVFTVVVSVTVSNVCSTLSDLVSLNCTGRTPRLAGQVDDPLG